MPLTAFKSLKGRAFGYCTTSKRHMDMEKEKNDMATCKVFAIFMFLPEEGANYACTKCRIIVLLEEKTEEQEARFVTLKEEG